MLVKSHKCREACSFTFKLFRRGIPCPSNFSAGDKKLTSTYIQCKDVSVAVDCAPIKVDGSHYSNSGIDERAIGKCNVS